jgi:hypothetical protein
MQLTEIDWNEPTPIKLLLLLGTYRAFIEKKPGMIPGLNGNITIPGAVFTCFRLGIGVEA